MSEGYSSDEGDVPQQQQQQKLSKKEQQEIERRRLKNKKKKESKKRRVKEDEPLDPGVDGDILGGGGDVVQEVAQPEDKEIKTDKDDNIEVEIEYVGADPELDNKDPNFGYFASIFNAFKIGSATEVPAELPVSTGVREIKKEEAPTRAAISEKILQEEMSDKRKELEEAGAAEPMSKRKLRLSMQPSIAKLKEITHRPDVVEWADVTSRDPFLLVALKAYRNTVPVPRHWNAKRKYLAGKRGFERAPFELPDFIRRTGIQEMRESMWEKQDHQSLKSKMRERARPKLGKIDIDYQKLHDAFFKWQTKPMMTKMGELYFEGKELEAQMRDKKPGELSDELRIALGMPVGPNAHKFPPPWLIAMQRYGPPPSYPNLKIPGLNAPIPENCSFGYHAGGWGKPPVDEFGKPLYGDVFGLETPIEIEPEDESVIERRFWGEIGSDEEESDSDVESEPEEREDAEVQTGFETPHTEGLATPSGLVSGVPTGVETPDTIELRKKKQGDESVAGDSHGVLYQVLPEKRVDNIRGQMMASTHVYEINKKVPAPSAHSDQGVEVSLNPDDVDDGMDQKGLEKHYEEHLRKQQRPKDDDGEDFSDMVAEHSAKQNRKRKAQEQKKTSSSSASSEKKKYKDFKF